MTICPHINGTEACTSCKELAVLHTRLASSEHALDMKRKEWDVLAKELYKANERFVNAKNKLADVEKREQEWKTRFQKYGSHTRNCKLNSPAAGFAPCTCGFDALQE